MGFRGCIADLSTTITKSEAAIVGRFDTNYTCFYGLSGDCMILVSGSEQYRPLVEAMREKSNKTQTRPLFPEDKELLYTKNFVIDT